MQVSVPIEAIFDDGNKASGDLGVRFDLSVVPGATHGLEHLGFGVCALGQHFEDLVQAVGDVVAPPRSAHVELGVGDDATDFCCVLDGSDTGLTRGQLCFVEPLAVDERGHLGVCGRMRRGHVGIESAHEHVDGFVCRGHPDPFGRRLLTQELKIEGPTCRIAGILVRATLRPDQGLVDHDSCFPDGIGVETRSLDAISVAMKSRTALGSAPESKPMWSTTKSIIASAMS